MRLFHETDSRPTTSIVHSPSSINTNCGYMGMWHAIQNQILLIGLSPKGTTQHGRDQGDATGLRQVEASCSELQSMEGGLHGDSRRVTAGNDAIGYTWRGARHRMPMIDRLMWCHQCEIKEGEMKKQSYCRYPWLGARNFEVSLISNDFDTFY